MDKRAEIWATQLATAKYNIEAVMEKLDTTRFACASCGHARYGNYDQFLSYNYLKGAVSRIEKALRNLTRKDGENEETSKEMGNAEGG